MIQELEPMQLVECFTAETNTCRITNICALKHFLSEANQAFITALNRYTLADTIRERDSFLQVLKVR